MGDSVHVGLVFYVLCNSLGNCIHDETKHSGPGLAG